MDRDRIIDRVYYVVSQRGSVETRYRADITRSDVYSQNTFRGLDKAEGARQIIFMAVPRARRFLRRHFARATHSLILFSYTEETPPLA